MGYQDCRQQPARGDAPEPASQVLHLLVPLLPAGTVSLNVRVVGDGELVAIWERYHLWLLVHINPLS